MSSKLGQKQKRRFSRKIVLVYLRMLGTKKAPNYCKVLGLSFKGYKILATCFNNSLLPVYFFIPKLSNTAR